MTFVESRSFVVLIIALMSWRGSAENGSNNNNCKPLTLQINNKVRHRPHHLTIAHRGASAHLPEHTLGAYRLALELGADFIEPDLLATSDGQLIAMHSMDLQVATDVTEKFPTRQPWFSPWANRTGFWVFNFTAQEIATLKVQQTITNEGRTQLYDGLWSVPTLTDVLTLLVQWNTVDLPKRLRMDDKSDTALPDQPVKPNSLQLAQSGMYVELKDTEWLWQEAGISVVDLLLQHLQQNPSPWQRLLPCFDEMQFDAFKVPGLVIQSFAADALTKFHQKWPAANQNDNAATIDMPEPPYVLLIDKEQCDNEEFWFKVGDTPRELISAIGCDKTCLIAKEPYTITSLKAEEFGLEIHAWTERPEQTYVIDQFADEMEEMEYLYCHMGIQGVFSESVSTAVTAAWLPCDEKRHNNNPGTSTASDSTEKEEKEESPDLCYDSAGEAGFFTGVAAFVMGVFVTSLFFVGYGRHYIRWQSRAVPSADDGGATNRRMVVHDEADEQDLQMEEWQATAAAVDEWRSAQLATAAHADEEHHGLELT